MSETDHILIVEDEPITREQLVAYFEEEGFRVSSTGSGDEVQKIIDETDVYVDVDNHVKVDGRSKFVRTGALISSRRHRRDAPTHRGFARRISRS